VRVADIFGPGDVWVEDPPEPTILALTDAIIRRRRQALDGRQAIKVLPQHRTAHKPGQESRRP